MKMVFKWLFLLGSVYLEEIEMKLTSRYLPLAPNRKQNESLKIDPKKKEVVSEVFRITLCFCIIFSFSAPTRHHQVEGAAMQQDPIGSFL